MNRLFENILPSPSSSEPEFLQERGLEKSVQIKLLEIIGGENRDYRVRICKTGVFSKRALRIHSRPLLMRRWAPYLAPDRLSHLLSLPDLSLSENLWQAVQHLILIPELARSQRYLLSHIYLPQNKTLAFYLSPSSLLPDRKLCFQDFARERELHRQRRIEGKRKGSRILGLWGRAFEGALDCWACNSIQIHSFLLPLPGLPKEELLALEEVHELYAHLRLSSTSI